MLTSPTLQCLLTFHLAHFFHSIGSLTHSFIKQNLHAHQISYSCHTGKYAHSLHSNYSIINSLTAKLTPYAQFAHLVTCSALFTHFVQLNFCGRGFYVGVRTHRIFSLKGYKNTNERRKQYWKYQMFIHSKIKIGGFREMSVKNPTSKHKFLNVGMKRE